MGGLLDLGGGGTGAAAPGQFSDDVAVGDPETGVALDPSVTLLLRLAGLQCGIQRSCGLLGGQRVGGLRVVRYVSAGATSPRAGRLGALDLGECVLGLLATFGGTVEYAAAVGWGLVQELAEPVAFAAQLRGRDGVDV